MKGSEERRKPRGRLIPDGELPCIWMDAGVVSYKLCNYQDGCETCPFDAEMRTSGTVPQASACEVRLVEEHCELEHEGRQLAVPPPEVLKECFYHTGHTWVLLEAEPEEKQAQARIGVDSFAAKVLPRVKDAILPHGGRAIHQGQVFCWLVCASSTMPIVAPIGGTVAEVNPRLREHPWLVNLDPHGDGWFVLVEPNDLDRDLAKLMRGKLAASWMVSERKKFERLASLLKWPANPPMVPRPGPEVGITLADGGEWIKELSESDSVSEYFSFIAKFFL